MSTFFCRTLREDPADAEVASHKLLVRAGYIRRAAPGVYTWMPLGLKVLNNISQVIREEMNAIGAQECSFPVLLPREPYEATNRWDEYGPSLFKLKDRKNNDYLLAPTHEEMFTLLVKDLYSSYKDLPVSLYQIQTKYRDEARPRAGLIRGREFVMKDSYSFDLDDEGLDRSYELHRQAYQKIFTRLGLDYAICSATSGAMGGSRSEEFLFPCDIGEDTFVRSPGGFSANVEAVTTVVPPTVDASAVPAKELRLTPGTNTIAKLVDYSNEHYPRADRPWQAGDMLKHVVMTAEYPDGSSEIIVVAIPGDRELDDKRLEAALYPAALHMSTEEELAQYPDIIPGFIGPEAVGPNSPARKVDSDGKISGSPRFLVDPRIVEGTAWIAGGNQPDHHVYNLVMGRDFTADGVIEAAEVLPGDPAPDGSGPLETARGIEIGHIFQLGRKYCEALDCKVLDQNGKTVTVTMGSYGIGVSRVMAAIAQEYHDEAGLSWPTLVAPFQVHVLATGKDAEIFAQAEALAEGFAAAGLEVLYDDREKVSAGVKFKDAELLGMPYVVVVGRGLKDGVVEVRNRRSGERIEVPLARVHEQVVNAVHEDLA